MPPKSIVCHLSFNHSPFDDRIYWKELIALKEYGFETVHIGVGETDKDFTSNEGIRIIQVKKRKIFKNVWINRIAQLFFIKKSTIYAVFEKAKAINASVYHYHDLQLNAIAKYLKKLPQKPKVVYDAHEAYHLLFKENMPANVIKRVLYKWFIVLAKRWEIRHASYCDYLIATDQYTLDYFNQHLPSIPKAIVYNYSFFLPQTNNTIEEKKYRFIYTGLLSKGRGITAILQAISLLVKEFSDVKVLFIGPFENEAFEALIRKQITKLNLDSHIEIKASVPFTAIAPYYEASCIGLGLFQPTPKYTTFVPIKLFEYMAFGLPVIFSNHGPSSQIIAATHCGLLVEPDDIEAIYEAMKTLLTDNELYKTLSLNGFNAVKSKYNWKLEKEKLIKIYAALVTDETI